MSTCRSELARDGPEGDAFIQQTRVIVNVHREHARSYKGQRSLDCQALAIRACLFLPFS
ncbi:transposase [Pseudomonas sp. IT-P253]